MWKTFPQIYSDNATGRSASSLKFSAHSPVFETSISSPRERPTPWLENQLKFEKIKIIPCNSQPFFLQCPSLTVMVAALCRMLPAGKINMDFDLLDNIYHCQWIKVSFRS